MAGDKNKPGHEVVIGMIENIIKNEKKLNEDDSYDQISTQSGIALLLIALYDMFIPEDDVDEIISKLKKLEKQTKNPSIMACFTDTVLQFEMYYGKS